MSAAPYFNYSEFGHLEKKGKYRYILEVVHHDSLEAAKAFAWNEAVLQKAYADVLASDFIFKFEISFKIIEAQEKRWKIRR